MKTDIKSITINGIEYVEKGSVAQPQAALEDMVLVRGDRSGVFYGELYREEDRKVMLKNARRVWYWSGAASLSQLAVDGTSKPDDCKFPCAVASIMILDAIEIIPLTQKALDSLNSVPVWKQ